MIGDQIKATRDHFSFAWWTVKVIERRKKVIRRLVRESGIEPLPSWQCEADHFDTRVERQNALADAFSDQIESDAAFRQSLAAIATNVLGRLTLPAPENHLTDQELLEFLACCVNPVDWRHIRDYERYAAYHAHLGACANCDGRLRAKHGAVAEGYCS